MSCRAAVLFVVSAICLALASPARATDPPFLDWSALLPGLTQQYVPTSENACAAGRTACVDAVVAEMERRFEPLASTCDHNAIFGLSYLRTTQEYRRTIEDPTFFEDTAFVNHEDAVFASYYFGAVDAWRAGNVRAVPPAWRVAFGAADSRSVSAAGDLALGINAHVQRDLPFVLAAIGLVKPDGSSRKTDHDRVNRILNRVNDDLNAEIAARFDPTIAATNLPTVIDDVVSFQIIPAWRELAWRNAERLVAARTPAGRAWVAATIESAAAVSARALRRATTYPLWVGLKARDSFCAAHG